METLEYIKNKYEVDLEQESPIKLPIDRFRGLTSIFNELDMKKGAEIGVDRGRYSKWICIKNRGVKLYCIDPWKKYEDYVESHHRSQEVSSNQYKFCKKRLAQFDCKLIKKTSMEAVKDFEDNSLDFVFIDGNHTFEYAVEDIAKWSKKVRPGGIVAGHDYLNSIDLKKVWVEEPTYEQRLKLCQVKDAVDAWTKTNKIKPWFITSDNCWLYIKQL